MKFRTKSVSNLQTGQAIPEFLAFAIAMVPIFLMIPMLGKISDMNQKTLLAARYGAWERTVWRMADDNEAYSCNQNIRYADQDEIKKNNATLEKETQKRLFGRNNVFIATCNESPRERDRERSYLWRTASDKPILARFSDVRSADPVIGGTGNGYVNGGFSLMKTGVDGLFGSSSIDSNGLYRSTFTVNVATNPKLKGFEQGKDCNNKASNSYLTCIRRHNTIYTDLWDAGHRELVKKRVTNMVPLENAKGAVDTIAGLFDFLFPGLKTLDLGHVEPDEMPEDRLGSSIRYRRN